MTHDEIMALTDEQLDCAAAVAQGWVKCGDSLQFWGNDKAWVWAVKHYHPSSNGNQLLEIMNREKIGVYFDDIRVMWIASIVKYEQDKGTSVTKGLGKTINQAVLRCYLLSKQGGNNG